MRKLATVKVIDALHPIEGADNIETAIVGGWNVVVKKGEHNVGQRIIMCEIDSWIPHNLAPFLTKEGHFPKVYNGVEGQKLKTAKLRGQLSQGLILPLEVLWSRGVSSVTDNEDVTEQLGIQKWEAPVSPEIAGLSRGSFPSLVPKTDQERIQNLTREFIQWSGNPFFTWEQTEKLEGCSSTFYVDLDGIFHVCSRNINLKESETNTFWKVAREYDIEGKINDLGLFGIAIQGEIVGPGIEGNIYNLDRHKFFVYDVFDVQKGFYTPKERHNLINTIDLPHVPIFDPFHIISGTVSDLLEVADGMSIINPQVKREGLVYKCNEMTVSFKTVSNNYLLKKKKEK